MSYSINNPTLVNIPEKFKTTRTLISIYEPGDEKDFLHFIKANFDHLQEEFGEINSLNSVQDAEAYILSRREEWLSRKRFVPKIINKSDGRMIGQLWIEPRWDRMIFEIGYCLEEKSQGQGFATETVKKMISFLFTELNANKLEILTKATNERSIGIPVRCGFTKEAQLRERSRTNAGEAVDLLIFGLLKREYKGK